MVMLTWVEVEPPELLAQTVYVTAVVCLYRGVPEIRPVLELKDNPYVAIEGLISQVSTAPPLVVGSLNPMLTPLVKIMSCCE